MDLRRTFLGGRMEKDSDERLLQDGFYRHAENIMVLESEGSNVGAVQNSLSNIKLTNIAFGSNAKCVGGYSNELTQKLYWLIKSDLGCYLIEYDRKNKVSSKVLEDTRTGTNRVFDLKDDNFVTAIDIVSSEEEDKDLMIINDDNMQPLCFNIKQAKSFGPNGFDKEDIYLIKKPPRFSPSISPVLINNSSNYLEDKFFSFAYRYRYENAEYSAISSFTNAFFYPDNFKLDYQVLDNLGMVNKFNAVKITINTGDKRVTDVQCLFKNSNSNNIYLINSFNKENEGWGDNEIRDFVFSNDKIYTVLPEKELYRPFDNVPIKAKAQCLIGNILFMGNFVEGYDLIDKNNKKVNLDFNLSLVSENLEGTTRPVTIGSLAPSTQNLLTIDLSGVSLRKDSRINLFFSLDSVQSVPKNYAANYSFLLTKDFSSANELAQDADFDFFITNYITNLFLSSYSITDIPGAVLDSHVPFEVNSSTDNSITIKAIELIFLVSSTPQTVYWKFKSSTNVLFYEIGSISSAKTNRGYQIGFKYLDEFNRSTPVLTQLNNTIFIPHDLALSKNKIKVTVNHTPPVFADRFKIVVKQQQLKYHTIYATTFYSEGLFRWVKLENDNKDKVKVGDVLIFKSDTSGFVPTLTKVKILEIETKQKEFIEGNVDPNNAEIKELAGLYMKIKLPAGISMDYNSDSFFEATGQASSKGDNFDMFIGPFSEKNSSGTYVDVPIKQGSRIDLELHNIKYGSSGGNKDFSKTYYVSADYPDFEIWYNTEVANNTSPFIYPTNGLIRGVPVKLLGKIVSVKPDPQGALFLRIHNELNGNGQHASYMDGKVNIIANNGLIIFETEESKEVNEEIYYETEQTFEIVNGLHHGNLQNQTNLDPAIIDLNYFNCFSQGNGAESYIVKDSFNKPYLNIDTRPSAVQIEKYRSIRRKTDLIFSEPYVESSNINGLNSFITATQNYKELDKQFGSVQKLFSRDNDILVLKEHKASKVLFEKDVLTNADGSTNVTSNSKILGPEIPYLGDNGIGKNPESFAENNYQVYYANPKQGTIIRLSIDGATEIVNGMGDFFRDLFSVQPNSLKIGGFDPYSKQYTLSVGEEPIEILQLNCGNTLIKNEQTEPFSYNLKLNDLSGDVIINYNITIGAATVLASFDGNNYVASNVSGIGNLTFQRTNLNENNVLVSITPTTPSISYEVGNSCPTGSQIKIVNIVLNDAEDAGKNITHKFKWNTSSFYETEDVFEEDNISKFFVETGIEGIGKFPLNNSVITLQSYKNNSNSGKFSLDECNKVGYLISDNQYTEANIDFILSEATFLNVTTTIDGDFAETNQANFFLNKSDSDQILYIIWDYTNRKPNVSNDEITVEQGNGITFDPKSNDSNPGATGITLSVISEPSNGNLVVNPDGTFTYTHNNSYTPEDVFSYQLTNGTCSSDIAVVNVSIDLPKPEANADFISVNRGQSIIYDIDANDVNPEGGLLTINIITQPTKGTLVLNPDNTITYTHSGIDATNDTFVYTISNSVFTSDPATVTISIITLTPPVALDDSISVTSGGTITISQLVNDTYQAPITCTIITAPSYGTATVNPNNTISYTHNNSANYNDSIVYQLSNGYDTSTATIYISVGVPCSGLVTANGNAGVYEAILNVGTATGWCGIKYDAAGVPDRFEIYYNNIKVADSKYVGDGLNAGPPVSYNGLLGTKSGFQIFIFNGSSFVNSGNTEPTFTVTQSDIANNITEATDGTGTLLFNKETALPTTIKIKILGVDTGTAWNFSGICPVPTADLKVGSNKIVWGFYGEANKTSLAKTKSMNLFLQTSPPRFYTNAIGHTDFNSFGYVSPNGFFNDGITWWEIDAVGNILSSGTI